MKILHTIEGMGAKFGGIATCTYDLLQGLHSLGEADIRLLTFQLKDSSDKLLGERRKWLQTIPNDGLGPLNYSRNAIHAISDNHADLYHINGMWQHICHATAVEARKEGKPYIITPHGMLYPDALKINFWKKWPMLKIWFRKDILRADAFHATCETEMLHLRELGYKGPIAVIGNPVRIPEYLSEISPIKPTNPVIGFLGRLHPIKRIEAILQGAALRQYNDLEIVIIGAGDQMYETFLKEEAKRLGIASQVKFTGFLNGREKFEQLSRLSALFVPSDMENFGMIVPEALLVGTPVMASLGTPWKDLNDYRCGWWTENTPESIATVIDDIYSKSPSELLQMGLRGRNMILEKYKATKISAQMLNTYSWLLGQAEKPDFIHLS